MLIACKDKGEISKLTMDLKSEFKMKNPGIANRILGVDNKRDRIKGTLTLSQSSCLKKVMQLFDMHNCKPSTTPIHFHFKLYAMKSELSKDKEAYMKKVPYSNVVGSLMYAMIGTRLDIEYGVSLVSRFMNKPTKEH